MYEIKERYETAPGHVITVKMTPGFGTLLQCQGGDADVPLYVPPMAERIEVIRSNNDPKKRREWKDVDHYKLTCSKYSAGGTYPWIANSTSAIGWWRGNCPVYSVAPLINGYTTLPLDAFSLYQPDGKGYFVPQPPQVAALINRSLDRMVPQVKPKLSILNSILELRDVKSVPRTVSRMAKFLSRQAKRFRNARRRTTGSSYYDKVKATFGLADGPTLRETLQTSADSNLMIQFGLLPILSDLVGIQTALIQTQSEVNLLLQNEGKMRESTFTGSFNSSYLDIAESEQTFFVTDFNGYSNGHCGVYGGTGHGHKVHRLYDVPRGKFVARMRYNYVFTDAQRRLAPILGFLDAIGLPLTPSTIWNAIPFSFLLDWVVGIDQYLNTEWNANRSFAPTLNIHGYMYSVKMSRTVRSYFESYTTPPPGMPTVQRTLLPEVRETAYSRRVGVPTASPVIQAGLSLNQIGLGLSLFLTRKSPRNRI